MFKKIFQALLWIVGSLIVAILIFLLFSIVPIDRTPVYRSAASERMMKRLDSLKVSLQTGSTGYRVGFAKENITPHRPVALAGYGNRRGKVYTAVLDSIYVSSIIIQNDVQRIAIVGADLLIIPPTVVKILEEKLPSIGFSINNTYLGATHTHNSIGNWSGGLTRFMYGAYSDSLVHFIAGKIIRSIEQAAKHVVPARLRSAEIPLLRPVRNRLKNDYPVDSLFRIIEIVRNDSTKGILMSYTAHATCLFSRDMVLSRDYPGKLVDQMEASGYDFAMFMAGAVGSHGCNPPKFGEPCIDWMSDQIQHAIESPGVTYHDVNDSLIAMVRVRLELPESQAKISPNWAARPWLFHAAFGEYPVHLTALRIGNMVLLGTPCDFSGELSPPLDSLAGELHQHAMITSFNGGYIGYVTPEKYYDTDHYETQLMNWYGIGMGEYLSTDMKRLLEIISAEKKK